MIIPFLSKYRQQWQFEKQYWLTRAEKKRAFWLLSGLAACVTILIYLWIH
jgi:hypothetical protein